MKKSISDMSIEELRTYCDHNGIEYAPKANGQALRSKIMAVAGGDEVMLPDAEPEPSDLSRQSVPVMAQAANILGIPDGKVRVLIHEHERDEHPVQLAVNGRMMIVHRGSESDIPYAYFQVLDNARRNIYVPTEDGIVKSNREVHTYPFTVIGFGTPVDGWEKQSDMAAA